MSEITEETADCAPDLSLVVGPEDDLQFVSATPGRHGRELLYVAVHRRHGTWTHVYRVVEKGRADHLLVHLEKVYDGDRLDEAQQWAQARLAAVAA